MIELWFHYVNERDLDTDIVIHAPCVPHIGSLVETGEGQRKVVKLVYDYHKSNGEVRVHVGVK